MEEIKTQRDPIDHFRTYMIETLKIKEDQIKVIDGEVKEMVLEAVEFSKTSPEPDPSELYTDILREETALQ